MHLVNIITGEKVKCNIGSASLNDLKKCKTDFKFDWISENKSYEIFKLFTLENPNILQALISFRSDEGFIYMSKVERAKFHQNEIKVYTRIIHLMTGFVCKISFERNFDGFVVFQAKTLLIKYYQRQLGAVTIGGTQRMFIDTFHAQKLVTLLYED